MMRGEHKHDALLVIVHTRRYIYEMLSCRLSGAIKSPSYYARDIRVTSGSLSVAEDFRRSSLIS